MNGKHVTNYSYDIFRGYAHLHGTKSKKTPQNLQTEFALWTSSSRVSTKNPRILFQISPEEWWSGKLGGEASISTPISIRYVCLNYTKFCKNFQQFMHLCVTVITNDITSFSLVVRLIVGIFCLKYGRKAVPYMGFFVAFTVYK